MWGDEYTQDLVIVLYSSQAPTYGLLPGCNKSLQPVQHNGIMGAGSDPPNRWNWPVTTTDAPTHGTKAPDKSRAPLTHRYLHTSSPSRDGIESGFSQLLTSVSLPTASAGDLQPKRRISGVTKAPRGVSHARGFPSTRIDAFSGTASQVKKPFATCVVATCITAASTSAPTITG